MVHPLCFNKIIALKYLQFYEIFIKVILNMNFSLLIQITIQIIIIFETNLDDFSVDLFL